MSKHKSEDYKISAVKYYFNNDVRFLIVQNNLYIDGLKDMKC